MATRLQEIRGKIERVKELVKEEENYFIGFLNVLNIRSKGREPYPFETFYNDICGDFVLGLANQTLQNREGISPLTEEDIRHLYEHQQKYKWR